MITFLAWNTHSDERTDRIKGGEERARQGCAHRHHASPVARALATPPRPRVEEGGCTPLPPQVSAHLSRRLHVSATVINRLSVPTARLKTGFQPFSWTA